MGRGDMEFLAVPNKQIAVCGVAEIVRLLQYRLEHWREIAR